MTTLDEPLSVKIAEWRQAEAEGRLTIEQMRQIVASIRQGRLAAAQSAGKARARKEPIDGDALANEIDAL